MISEKLVVKLADELNCAVGSDVRWRLGYLMENMNSNTGLKFTVTKLIVVSKKILPFV